MDGQTNGGVGSSAAGWCAVALLCAALLLSLTDRLIINLVVDPIRADLRLTDLDISLLQGAGFAVIFALAGLPAGRLADRVNRRNLIAGGLALWSAATIACGLAGDFWSFLAARIAVGLGEAALVPAAASLIVDSFSPRRRGLALGVFSLGATFGAGSALFLGGVLLGWIEAGWFAWAPGIALLASWRQLLVLAGLPGFLLLPLLFLIREPMRRHSAGLIAISGVLSRLAADNGMVLRVCLVKGALGVGDYALIAWLPTLLQRSHGMTALEAGGLVGLSLTASGVVASVAGGALSDRLAQRWGAPSRIALLLACYLLALAGAVSTLFAQTGGQIALSFAIWALGSISGYVIGHVVMQESVPNEMRATTVALSLAVTALVGIGLGPTLVPLVAQHVFGGETALQPAMSAISVGAALLALLVIWPSAFDRLRTLQGRLRT
ncbi:MFS transporter [Caulobacter endophyticus]|uniref:MFS transporter n=1 Tax=Caulobacter endophyticus TaxID=2172652 RepID=A0A2T9JEM2_9CAUL|nr:MFS transporter [Caulobacter endophyticus]PVM82152.1 MFS transporter [Caulobacter endophyticus]